ncbi:Deoxyribonuclease, TatD [Cordyceps fumosorosea ARSEF 2679]|uniref:Deoxyribonuclease, TatD n=1 Tax=Cordyceps fumosorosea (strain ARSEF 2679) TaxID=1081104 RepID=A0A168ANK9_CORFA|nr:Deoxyribonuclease, TatD [Cordyceps fumosorosea ARSEF 2679]OAA68983.1 Deoxyribonuclease, TatD [Cordyceps fumosorosea ARSEF 2679]
MCQHEDAAGQGHHASPRPSDSFPWHLGVYDAHCHPTDTMASIERLGGDNGMRASVLTIMATRSQDQDLVAQVAAAHGLAGRRLPADGAGCKVVPSFGWHPWFAHQLYDDTPSSADDAAPPTYSPADDTPAAAIVAKHAHYRAVLQPVPPADADAFLDSLPDPAPLSAFIASTRARLAAHPLALVGEMGLDKASRIPEPASPSSTTAAVEEGLTPGSREDRRLSPYRVSLSHQRAVLAAQLTLAGRERRAVSLHGVQAHGVLHDAVSRCWAGWELPSRRERRLVAPHAEEFPGSSEDEEGGEPPRVTTGGSRSGPLPYPPRICLHSFSGSAETLAQWMARGVPARVYASLSAAVNLSTAAGRARTEEVVRAAPDDRLLVESDLHRAGEEMDGLLEHMYRFVCEVKGWGLEEGVARIRSNYQAFIFGQ